MNSAPTGASEAQLKAVWAYPSGFIGWLTNVNHRAIGTRFMVTAFIFFLVAGIEALIMRLQLSSARATITSPETFNQLFTMHGSTMMFLFVVPFLEGLAIYLVPLMIGTRDMAFPRLNAFGYWVFLISGVALHVSLLAGIAPNVGWFNYPPLSGPGFSPGLGIDFWVTMITFIEVSALAAALEIVVTAFMQRAPGMALHRMPLFVWSAVVMAFMIIFAMPPLIVTSLLLALDRFAGAHFFNVIAGGSPLLWQHLFWFFGHPDVYIMLLPALGIASAIIPASVRHPIAGYKLVAASFVAIGILSFGLWVHHMYAAGLPLLGMSFFAAASMMITVPSGISIAALIVTIWRGTPLFNTAFLFIVGFIVLFMLGGITGIMVAAVPFDWQVHDTYFVVAHFHYVLVGGVVFPIFAAIYFWFPKITGRLLSERLGKWNFWLLFVGFNITFFPLHILGFQGMPRRVYTYQEGLGWEPINLIATGGAFLIALGSLAFLVNAVLSLKRGERAPGNPWSSPTLEWATASPPHVYNFNAIPVVHRADPLWQQPTPSPQGMVIDSPEDVRREVLTTTAVDATAKGRVVLPGPSIWPLWLALALALSVLGAIINLWLVPLGLLFAVVALAGWHWPKKSQVKGGDSTS